MSERAIADPSQHGWVEVDGKWKWDVASGGGGGESYDDAELRGLISTNASAISTNASAISTNGSAISTNASAISTNSDRIDALESGGGGGDSLWTDNGDGTISSAKTAKAPDFIAG